MIAALAVAAVALALWALIGFVFADDLRDLDRMDDFEDTRTALSRATRTRK